MNNAPCVTPCPILLPREGTSMERWAVVACDQFTSNEAYWEDVRRLTRGAPSALDIVLPEIWLDRANEMLPGIHAAMDRHAEKTLCEAVDGYVYVERETAGGLRRGLVARLDLERYDYAKGSQSAVRATEGTIEERLPPRMRVRDGASLETPHVMALIDDRDDLLFSYLSSRRDALRKLYGFDLMQGGGRIDGYAVETAADRAFVPDVLRRVTTRDGIQLAVGDGNHSLASAKALWESKKAELPADHPLRYALIEICNLYDPSLRFEPIHRVLFGVDPEDVLRGLSCDDGCEDCHAVEAVVDGERRAVRIARTHTLPVGALQLYLDRYLSEHPKARIDYIHGDEEVLTLARGKDSIGFLLEGMDKEMLFESVAKNGVLPRKTFSMGHARDKRYYLEARALR